MQTPSSTPSVSSPPPHTDPDPVPGSGFGGPLPPLLLDQATAEIRPLLLPEAPNGTQLPEMALTVARLAAEAAAAEHAGFGALAYRRRLLRLRQILERYQWQARQSQARWSRAQQLSSELQAIAEEERVGRRVMSVALDEFNRIATAPRYDN